MSEDVCDGEKGELGWQKMAHASGWFKLGCASACLAVGFGAFGAHALKNSIQDTYRLKTWDTAVEYHMFHSVALCLGMLMMLLLYANLCSSHCHSCQEGTV